MKKTLRCAVYTRKSTEEGLDQDFNSLDAQREACEAYIQSQAAEGWKLLKTQYNDGGFSGGNLERPHLQRLEHFRVEMASVCASEDKAGKEQKRGHSGLRRVFVTRAADAATSR